MGTCATMVLPMLACQMRTVARPSRGSAAASINPASMAKGPTAADRLPQLPDQSTSARSIATWPKR